MCVFHGKRHPQSLHHKYRRNSKQRGEKMVLDPSTASTSPRPRVSTLLNRWIETFPNRLTKRRIQELHSTSKGLQQNQPKSVQLLMRLNQQMRFPAANEDGSAVEGRHYERTEGDLCFAQDEMTQEAVQVKRKHWNAKPIKTISL